jgi:hypothetical protein
MKNPIEKPPIHSCWRRKKTGQTYTVRSVDMRGVFLKTVVAPGFCRLPLERFLEQFERVAGK